MVLDKLKKLRLRMKEACQKVSRDPDSVKLVLVTKQVDIQLVREAYEAGVRDFGENRVQEWLEKAPELPNDVDWHLIGHLQTNKTKYWVGKTKLVHSMDSDRLAAAIQEEAKKKNVQVDCLLQVNTSGEESKFGVKPDGLLDLARSVTQLSNLKVKGLMTIGPLTEDQQRIRSAFRKLRELSEEIKKKFPKEDWKYLSMGMSSDFEIAIEEGSNLIRVGTAVFGERQKI